MPQVLQRPLRVIAAVERAAGAILLLVLLVLVLVQTGVRFLPLGGWVWTGELARFCLVWLTFSVSGHLMEREGHITLEVIDLVTSDRWLFGVRVFANAVVGVISVGFAAAAYGMVTSGTTQTSPAMGLPLPLVFVIPLLAFVLTALRAALGVVWQPPSAADGPGDAIPSAPGGMAA